MKIGIIGNGNVGGNLAQLFTRAGHEVVAAGRAGGIEFSDAAAHGDVVILAIPFVAVADTLPGLQHALAGKIVVDATNPLGEDWSPLALPGGESAAETIQRALPNSRVVKAFNTIFADAMQGRERTADSQPTTAFLCGDDSAARDAVASLASDLDWDPVDAGPLLCARYLEGMAHLNIQLAVSMGRGTQSMFGYHRPTDFAGAQR